MKKISFFLFFALFWMEGWGIAGESPRIRASLDRARITIGDRVQLVLQVDTPQGSQVEFPNIQKQLGGLALKEFTKGTPKPLEGGWTRHAARAVVTAYDLGSYVISPISVTVRLPSTEEATVQTLQLFVQVVSVVPQGEKMEDIRDIKGPVSLPGVHLGVWFWIGVLLLCVLFVGILFERRRRARPKPVPSPPPHVVALQALEKIEAMGWDQKDIKEYYFLVSGVLRRYLEDRFGFRAPEQTTEEFLGEGMANHLLQEAQKKLLRSFLTHCDLVKFANYTPQREEGAWIFKTARDFIEETKPV